MPFPASVYAARRDAIRRAVGSGLLVVPANAPSWRNADRPHPYRQNSHLLYLAPIHRPGLMLILDADAGQDVLFGPPEDPDDVVWHGPHPELVEDAEAVGMADVREAAELPAFIAERRSAGQAVHLLPPLDAGQRLALSKGLGLDPAAIDGFVSEPFVLAIGEARLIKDKHEVEAIEEAVSATARMFAAAREAIAPGRSEAEIYAAMATSAYAEGKGFSFNPIVTVRGEVLHNETYRNRLAEGDLLLIDAGLETADGYAADITRTMPVSGTLSDTQRALYEAVAEAKREAIAMMRPGVSFRAIHDHAATVMARHLTAMGLMKGDPTEAVAAGAHALFFVHGLGHPLGLDVHDVHDLGDAVAYRGTERSMDFGTAFLRFGRELAEGMVMTVEPGLYFIPALIDRWRSENRHAEFIAYDRLDAFREAGGIRLEDDVLVNAGGARVLGTPIPEEA